MRFVRQRKKLHRCRRYVPLFCGNGLSRVRRRNIREILRGIGFPYRPLFVISLYHILSGFHEESLNPLEIKCKEKPPGWAVFYAG